MPDPLDDLIDSRLNGGTSSGATPVVRDVQGGFLVIDPNTGGSRFVAAPSGPESAGIPGVFQDANGYYVNEPRPGGAFGSVVGGTTQRRYLSPQELFSLEAQWTPPRTGGSGARGPQPDTYVDRNGNLVAFDPYTGRTLYTIANVEPGFDEQRRMGLDDRFRDFQLGEASDQAAFQRSSEEQRRREAFQSGESLQDRLFSARESQAGREFNAQQSTLDRAQQASQFAARLDLDRAADERAAAESLFNRNRALNQDRLNAANQYASLVSTTDPAALPAFFQAGGGNISNALASGATALSQNALLPAARTLRTIDDLNAQMVVPQQSAFQRGTAGVAVGDTAWSPEYRREVQARIDRQAGDIAGNAVVGNPSQVNFDPAVQQRLANMGIRDAGTQLQQAADSGNAGFTFDGRNVERRTIFAAGGFNGTVTEPTTFVAGEAGPEQVNIAPIRPQDATAQNIDPATGLPSLATTEDRPYLDRVRALREGVQFPQLNPYDVGYSRVAPTIRELFLRGRQTRFGLPVQDQIAEQQQYALRGTQRGAYRVAR